MDGFPRFFLSPPDPANQSNQSIKPAHVRPLHPSSERATGKMPVSKVPPPSSLFHVLQLWLSIHQSSYDLSLWWASAIV